MFATRTLSPLHLEDLEPHRFEDLVRQLLYDFRPWRRLEATGRLGGDDGFDARGWEVIADAEAVENTDVSAVQDESAEPAPRDTSADRLWLIQCKRERRIGPTPIAKYIEDIPEDEVKNIHGIVFAAACDFSKKARDAFRATCSTRGITEWHLWGKAEIEDRLFQPNNDHLLFAYFGFSLQIRKRSLKTTLLARLAMKRRAAKYLTKSYEPVLFRDATDARYPFLDEGEPKDRRARGRWMVHYVDGLEHDGVRVIVHRHFAALREDGSWDFAETMDDADLGQHEDPWTEKSDAAGQHDRRAGAMQIWDALPAQQKGWLEVLALLPFDDIMAIDEAGDEGFEHPQVYSGEWDSIRGPFKGYLKRITTIDYSRRTLYPRGEEGRVEIFPRRDAE